MPAIITQIVNIIINPLLLLMFGVAVIVFMWGIFIFISSEEKKDEGKQNMLYGVIGFFIMVSAYGIIEFIKSTIGV